MFLPLPLFNILAMKINLINYIAYRVPRQAYRLLRENRYYKIPRNRRAIAKYLADFVNSDKEKALLAIAKIHPDRELILKSIEAEKIEKKSEASEQLQAAGEGKLGEKSINLLIVAGSVVVAIALVTIIVTHKK
jgi:hypothetical protein